MNTVGSLKINKWHISLYTHCGPLHFKPSPMVGFNERFNVVEKSDGWQVLALSREWPFHGSEPGDGEQTSSFKENYKTPTILTGIQGVNSHICMQFAVTLCVADDNTVDLVPAHQPGRLWRSHFLIKNQHLDFVSYSNCMQYLGGVSGEWPCTKMCL